MATCCLLWLAKISVFMEEHGTECTHGHPFHPSFPVYMREICPGNGKGGDPVVSLPPPPPPRGWKWAVWKPPQANCYEIDEDEGVWSREQPLAI